MKHNSLSHFSIQTMSDWNDVIQFLKPKFKGKNLFLLEGDLGSGKTTFVSLVAHELGIELVSSPTFALIQHHPFKSHAGSLVHVDLYRVESMDEVEATGFWEIFEDPQAVIFVEWSSKIADDLWPLDWAITRIRIEKKSETEREVIVK